MRSPSAYVPLARHAHAKGRSALRRKGGLVLTLSSVLSGNAQFRHQWILRCEFITFHGSLHERDKGSRRCPPRVSRRVNPALRVIRNTTPSEIEAVRLGIVTVYKILSQRHYSEKQCLPRISFSGKTTREID